MTRAAVIPIPPWRERNLLCFQCVYTSSFLAEFTLPSTLLRDGEASTMLSLPERSRREPGRTVSPGEADSSPAMAGSE